MSLRRFFANPADAFAQNAPDSAPHTSEANDIAISMPPNNNISLSSIKCGSLTFITPRSFATTNGIRHSSITSNDTNKGVKYRRRLIIL